MPAPKGHPLWGNPLKPKKYTPEELWEGACIYFDWANENPWIKNEKDNSPSKPTLIDGEIIVPPKYVQIPIQRPYSIEAMCIHLNISRETFDNYSKTVGYETYFDICTHIRHIIDTQHFEGGMVGAFNANIVTRKLGLVEKKEIEGSFTGLCPINLKPIIDEES